MFPFSNPVTQRLITSAQKVLDRPNDSIEMADPTSPIIRTGFRPRVSENRLQWRTVMASVAKKRDSYKCPR